MIGLVLGLIGGAIGLIFGLAGAFFGVLLGLMVPLSPFLLIGLVIWLLVRDSSSGRRAEPCRYPHAGGDARKQ